MSSKADRYAGTMSTHELDALHEAMTILQNNGHRQESAAIASVLAAEAPKGWWSE
jgi:hypothetical protein